MAEPIAEAVNLADGDVSLGGDTPVAKADNKSGLPQWNSIEVYACVKAALSACEAKQQQTTAMLEALTQQKYGPFVLLLAEEENTWCTTQGKTIGWTPAKSAELRGHPTAGKIFPKFRDHYKPHIINVINQALTKLLNKDYSIPSGKNKEEIIDELKKSLYDEDQKRKKALAGAQAQKAPRSAKKRKVEDTSDALSPNLDAEGAAAAKAATEAKLRLEEAVQAEKHQKLRDAYDGGVVFLAWLRLGPWSAKPEPAFALSDETTPLPVTGGRKAQREGQNSYEIEKKAAAAAQDKAYKEGKLEALQLMGEAHKKSAEVRADMAKELSRTAMIAEKKAIWDSLDKLAEHEEWEHARQDYIKALRAPRPAMIMGDVTNTRTA